MVVDLLFNNNYISNRMDIDGVTIDHVENGRLWWLERLGGRDNWGCGIWKQCWKKMDGWNYGLGWWWCLFFLDFPNVYWFCILLVLIIILRLNYTNGPNDLALSKIGIKLLHWKPQGPAMKLYLFSFIIMYILEYITWIVPYACVIMHI